MILASESLGHKAAAGAVWATIDRFGSMAIQFVVNLVLARLLLPEDFGIIGILAIFLAVSQTIVDGGFGSALIQKKSPTEIDYSTIFYWNFSFSTFLYIILFLLAPYIARFYSMSILVDVLRVIAINLIITSILSIQKTRLQKELAFKKIAVINLGSYVMGGVIAILMAKHEFGVWSIVFFQLSYALSSVLLMFIVTRWLPLLIFSKTSIRELFGFGGYIMAANILQTISQNLQGLIIGKKFSATQMGYFSQAYKLDQVTSYSIPQVIVQVMYPVYSALQDDGYRLRNVVLMNLRVVSFIVFPLLILLIIVTKPLIIFLYGEKWLACAPYFQVFCLGGFFVCLQNINFYAVAAVGRSQALFKWSFYKWGFLLAALFSGMFLGMYGILFGMVLSNVNIFLANAYLASKYAGISVLSQIKSIIPVCGVILVGIFVGGCFMLLINNVILSAIVYYIVVVGLSIMIRLRAYQDAMAMIKRLLNH